MPLLTAIALFSTLVHALMRHPAPTIPGRRGRAIVTLEAEAPGAAPSSRSAVRCSYTGFL